jgi:two-component system NtrC family response regulator
VPVVVLTGHGEHEMALKATERGAWDFLSKPIDPDCRATIWMRDAWQSG